MLARSRVLAQRQDDPITARSVRELGPYHAAIQRDLTGEKLRNAKGDLKDYILRQWAPLGRSATGVLPAVMLVFRDSLGPATDDGLRAEFRLPVTQKALLLDAESRIESFLYAVEDPTLSGNHVEAILRRRLPVDIFHGISDVRRLAKYFADINGRGVRVTQNLNVARDYTDPWMEAA